MDWLERERIHFVASDAHNLTGRPLKLREAYQLVAKRRGDDVAYALFCANPLAAFQGEPIPYLPDPPPEKDVSRGFRKRKRFIFF